LAKRTSDERTASVISTKPEELRKLYPCLEGLLEREVFHVDESNSKERARWTMVLRCCGLHI